MLWLYRKVKIKQGQFHQVKVIQPQPKRKAGRQCINIQTCSLDTFLKIMEIKDLKSTVMTPSLKMMIQYQRL